MADDELRDQLDDGEGVQGVEAGAKQNLEVTVQSLDRGRCRRWSRREQRDRVGVGEQRAMQRERLVTHVRLPATSTCGWLE